MRWNDVSLLLLIGTVGCSGSPASLDLAVHDGPLEGSTADLGRDTVADLGPDGPKVPARWEVIAGAPQREDHTVTLLKDGRVLVVGGYQSQDGTKVPQKTAYIYDAASDTFSAAGDLATARSNHTATLLDDGRVLVVGGRSHPGYLTSTEIFDPTKPSASAWSAGPEMFESRWNHAAVKLANGEVLVTGGWGDMPLSSIALFDPNQKLWKVPSATMKQDRRLHSMTLLDNGNVLIVGGVAGERYKEVWLETLELFNPQSGTMTALAATMSEKRAGHTATRLTDGRVLIVGGYCGANCTEQNTDDIFDPKSGTVAPVAHAGSLPISHLSILLNDGRVAVIGAEYDPQKVVAFSAGGGGFWTKLLDLPDPHYRADGARLLDGSVIVIGGLSSRSPYTYTDKAHRLYP